MKRKIIFVLPQLKTGGGFRAIVALSNLLVKDFSVHFVLPNSEDDYSFYLDKEIKIEKIGDNFSGKLNKIRNILAMFQFLKKCYPNEIIVTTDPIISLGFIFYRFKNLFRYVQADDYRIFDDLLLLKNRYFLMIYKILTQLSYKQNSNYFFNSTYTYEQFKEIRGSYVPKEIVQPAIDQSVFFNQALREVKEKKNLCLVARKHPLKGFQDFIDVWSEIKNVPEVSEKIETIFIITHDDLLNFDIEDFKLIHPKNDKEIAQVYNKSDIFISTSWQEGFGLPPLEAMACGTVLLLSDSGGVNEYADSEYNCLMYTPKNKIELKQQLIKLLYDPILIEKLQLNTKESARKFTWESSVQQFTYVIMKEYL